MEDHKVHELIQSVLVQENMEDGVIAIKNAHVEIADGLMSEILRVTIDQQSTNKQLHLIIKVAPTDPDYRYIAKLMYISEIHFYETILPLFEKLQQKYIHKPITLFPKFFKATKQDCMETVILEDVSHKGYMMLNRKFVFHDDCMKLVLKELGKFHALSFALQKHDQATWNTLENGVDPSEIFGGEVIDWFQNSLKKATQLFQVSDPQIAAKLSHLHDNFFSVMKIILTPSTKYPSVIGHLDTWCNNFLFKFSDEKGVAGGSNSKVEDVLLIDWQQATKASPVLDVSCFLYLNGSADCIKNWKEMLQLYYGSLYDHANVLGCDLSKIYTWEMFLDDWKDYSNYGLIKSTMGISINTQDDEHLKVVEGRTLNDFFCVKNWNLKTVERIKCVIMHSYNEGFL